MPPRVARAWIRMFVLAACGAYVLAVAALGKAKDHGNGFQALMVAVTGIVLLVAVLVRRRAIAGAGHNEHGQHISWLSFVRFAALAAVLLAVIATIRSTPQQQAFPAIVGAVSLWLLTIVIRLDWAARDAASAGSAS